jgi:cell division septation protein DedD
MSGQTSDARERRRERMALSLMSLLILFGLIGGYVLLHASQKKEGDLGVLSTSQVTISVGGEESPAPADASSGAATDPTATATAPKPAGGRGPGLVTEVFSANDQPPSTAAQPGTAGGSSGASNSASNAAAPTSTRTSGSSSGTGVAPPGLSIGGTGPGGSGGVTSPPLATATSSASGAGATATAVAQPTSASQPTSVPTSGSGGPTAVPTTGTQATAVPTNPPPEPSSTPVPETVDPIGHHSHLHIAGFAAPGAYKAGGIIVSNIGPVAFDYSVSMTVTGDAAFASLLRLRIYVRVGATCDYPGQPPAPNASLNALSGDQVGTVLYDGTFTTGNKVGDPAAFPAAGDRHLNPGQSEVLCMEVFFPWTAGNEFQGLHVDGTQIFTAKSPDQ